MQGRRHPPVIGILAALATVLMSVLGGCATEPGESYPAPAGMRNTMKIDFEIQSTVRNSAATIYINGEERGDTPVHIRADLDATGLTAEDLVIKAVWGGGSSETEITIPKGSRPQAIVRVGPNGEREY